MRWDPWTGCYKISDGCTYCYYYGPFSKRCGQNTIERTQEFYKPIEKNTKGVYKAAGGKSVAVCFTTDFFLPEADEWRAEAWSIIKQRPDLDFMILTKRIDRFHVSLPDDWGDGYDNINLGCTVENQELADYRLPLFISYPIKRRFVACSPMLSSIDLSRYLDTGKIDHVTIAGESSREGRDCDYDWVLAVLDQCIKAKASFWFKATGSLFRRDGVAQKINPYKQGSIARELGINIPGGENLG